MIISYILVNQHNNVINWSLNQLDMLLFIKIKCYNNRIAREARRKFLARGGTKVFMGGTQNYLDGEGQALMGGCPPHSPHVGQPCIVIHSQTQLYKFIQSHKKSKPGVNILQERDKLFLDENSQK